MMTRTQYLLGKLAEEAAEICQIALKAQQFGLDDVWEKVAPLSVRDRLHGELNDLLGVVEMLNQESALGFLADPGKMEAKAEKVNRYADLSIALSLLDPSGSAPSQGAMSWGCPAPSCHFVISDRDFSPNPSRRCPWCDCGFDRFLPIPF